MLKINSKGNIFITSNFQYVAYWERHSDCIDFALAKKEKINLIEYKNLDRVYAY